MKIQGIKMGDALKLAAAFVIALLALEMAYAIKTVILIFFTSVILAMAMERPIQSMEAHKVPRTLSAATIYVSAILALVGLLLVFLPVLATEFKNFVVSYPAYSEALIGDEETIELQIMPYVRTFSESFVGSSESLLGTAFKMVGSITSFLAVFFIAFFINIQQGGVRSFINPFIPREYKESITPFLGRVQDKVSNWLWGKFLSSLLVALFTLFGLVLFGIPYAFMLAVLALFLNFIPFVGPIIAAIPAVILALTHSPLLATIVGLYYFFVNGILESFIFSPLLMRRAIQVNPALLILSVMSGAYLGGVLGIIIAIPVAAIAYLAVCEYTSSKQATGLCESNDETTEKVTQTDSV